MNDQFRAMLAQGAPSTGTIVPSVGIVYSLDLRHSGAPKDLLAVDMFTDALLPKVTQAGIFKPKDGGIARIAHAATGTTSAAYMPRELLPVPLQGKMSVLDVLHGSLKEDGRNEFSFCVAAPGVGLRFGTGVYWLQITQDDLYGYGG